MMFYRRYHAGLERQGETSDRVKEDLKILSSSETVEGGVKTKETGNEEIRPKRRNRRQSRNTNSLLDSVSQECDGITLRWVLPNIPYRHVFLNCMNHLPGFRWSWTISSTFERNKQNFVRVNVFSTIICSYSNHNNRNNKDDSDVNDDDNDDNDDDHDDDDDDDDDDNK